MLKILLVEDDEYITLYIKSLLEESGFEVINATNGIEGLKRLKENPDLVITDINMPMMNGIEFCNQLKKIEKFKYLPVLMLTVKSDIKSKLLGFDAGIDDYMTKPFESLELLVRIHLMLKKAELIKNSLKIKSVDENFFCNDFSVIIKNKSIILTAVEFEIFTHLYINNGKPISSKEILVKVLNHPCKRGNPGTVRTHIRNIRNKIEEDPNNPQILINIPKKGYFINKELI